jgi:hypothetical protein
VNGGSAAPAIRIITIEREYGVGGWKLWDQELTAEIARQARTDQKSWSAWKSGWIRSSTA